MRPFLEGPNRELTEEERRARAYLPKYKGQCLAGPMLNPGPATNEIREVSIDWKSGEVTFYFKDSDEPWDVVEFTPDSETHKKLTVITVSLQEQWEKMHGD